MSPTATRFGFAPRMALLYIALFGMVGVQLPFFPVWLTAKGLDPAMIGIVLAAPMVLRLVAVPIAARQADRRDALRATLAVTGLLAVACYAVLGAVEGVWPILILFSLASLFFAPVTPLAEAYALRGAALHGRAYGPLRLWGSAAFVVGSFAAGFAADLIPARHLIWLIVAACGATAVAAMTLAPLPAAGGAHDPASPQRSLLGNPAFIAAVAAANLIQASHAVYYGFSAVAWRADGFNGTTIAGLWALGVIAEIVLFALQGRLPPFFQPAVLLMAGAAGGALRWSIMAFDPPAVALPFLQLLHALSFGATHLGALSMIARIASAGQGATAQGYLSTAIGAVMAAMTALAGTLFAAYGSGAYAAMALAAVAGGVCAFIARRTSVARV